MWTARSDGIRRGLLCVGILITLVPMVGTAGTEALPTTAVAAPSDAYPSFLTIRINSQLASENALMLRAGKTGEQFFISTADAQKFRLALPAPLIAVEFEGAQYVLLNSVTGLSLTFDDVAQTLSVEAAPTLFQSATIALGATQRVPTPQASLGSFLSYDLYAQRSSIGPRDIASGGQFEWGFFSPQGVLTNRFFANRKDASKQLSRLETVFTIDDPSALTSWRIGDTMSQSPSWGSPSLFAGLQYATNFGTQPGFITYPLNSLSGQTALPSVVNVYVNNVLTATDRVPQGPFTLNNLPSINGRGEIRLMVRDLLGREQAIVQSLYGSTLLLRPGLNDFSFQAGTLRENYGITSNDYGRGFASGVWRRGVTAELTTETGMESARGRRAVGLGTTWLAGGYGEFSASFAHSVQAATTVERAQLPVTPTTNSESPSLSPVVSRSGHSRTLRWDWRSSQLTLGSQLRVTSPGFRTISSGGDLQRPRRELNIFASFGSALGSFGLNLTQIQRADTGQDILASPTKLAQLSWSKGFGRWGQLSLNAFSSLHGPTNHAITLGYFVPLDFTASAGVSSTRATANDRSRITTSTTFQRNMPSGDGYGYRMLLTDQRDAILGLTAQNEVGLYALDVSRLNGADTVRVGASGSLVYLGGEVAAGRRADDSFALVSVPDFQNVRVMLNNQEVGRTNARGNLFVPRLRPYENNSITIEHHDLPLSAEVASLKLNATPYLRSGLVLKFAVRESLGGIARFTDENGIPIRAGTTLSINGAPELIPIAERGEAYLTGLTETNRIRIIVDGKRCSIQVPYKRSDELQPFLGTFTCKLEN